MFTGIVQGTAVVRSIVDHGELREFCLEVADGFSSGIEIGASVSVDGVCLTVTSAPSPVLVHCDVMLQSLRITTLSGLEVGAHVNVERAAKDGAEIGGHPLSGHVDFTGIVQRVETSRFNRMLHISVPADFRRYVFPKGYIAVNGASLTLSEVNREEGWFELWLIPETRRVTTFDLKKVGDIVNVEIERGTQVVVDTVRDTVIEKMAELGGTLARVLAEKGVAIEDILAIGNTRFPKQ